MTEMTTIEALERRLQDHLDEHQRQDRAYQSARAYFERVINLTDLPDGLSQKPKD
jgi:hypothetical protein